MTTTTGTEERYEQRIREHMDKFNCSRREAARTIMAVLAELIADDVVMGEQQWKPRLEEYAYLRKLAADLYGEPAPFTREGDH